MDILFFLKVIIVVIAIAVGVATPFLLKKNDSPIEQIAEKVVKEETGWDFDFSAGD